MSSEIIPVSCDTELTEERNECRHVQSRMIKLFRGYQFIPNDYCPKCGEKL